MDSEYLRFVLALVLVLGLIFLLAWALRRFGFGNVIRPGGKRRLQVIESAAIGSRHRLVLVRRDQTEHLLLLGPTGDVVVESGVSGSAPGKTFEHTLAQQQGTEQGGDPFRAHMPTLRAERSDNQENPK